MPPGLTAKGSGLGRGQGTAIPGPPEGFLGEGMLEGVSGERVRVSCRKWGGCSRKKDPHGQKLRGEDHLTN